MKFNKMYVYILILVFAVAGVVIVATMSGGKKEAPALTEGAQPPADDMHSGLGDGTQPGAGNVKEDIKQKMADLEKAANENPNDTVKLLEYAEFMGMAHQTDKSIDGFLKYLKINPKNADVLIKVSSLYYQKQDFNNALTYINRALQIDPKNTESIYYLGMIEKSSGNAAKAKSTWEKLIKEYPGSQGAKLAEEEMKK
ncbi:MAG: hypothetical protein AMXMBFR49_25240 [Chlorobiota bacterium]